MTDFVKGFHCNGHSAALVLAGGGIDSSLCLHLLGSRGVLARAVHIDYGQHASNLEWQSVQRLSEHLGISSCQLQLQSKNHFGPGEVRGRNAAFIFLALMHLHSEEGMICIGVHAGTPYYDCSAVFFDATSKLVAEYTDGQVRLIAPLIQYTKPEIVALAHSSGLPLDMTYSCQQGVVGGCHVCDSCKDREALAC